MSDKGDTSNEGGRSPRNPALLYAIVAALLVVIIAIAVYLLLTQGIPALTGRAEPTAASQGESTATPAATVTAPTETAPGVGVPVMQDTDEPAFDLQSAGGRPGTEWTGFFGQVLDAEGNPLADVPLIVWYADAEGRPANLVDSPDSPIVRTDGDGNYEMRLANAPLEGAWSIQVLTSDGGPASKLFTFETSDSPETGFQQIQVIWQEVP